MTSTGAAASLMEQARTPHFLQMHAGPVDEQRMAAFSAGNPLVEEYAVVPMLNVDGAAIRVIGEGTDTTLAAGLQDNSFVAQNREFDHLLDTSGQIIDPAPGTVWLPLYYRESLDLAIGEMLTVTGPGETAEFAVAGFLRDSQMNSSYASSKRLLVAEEDLDRLGSTLGEAGSIEYLIQFRLTDAGAVGPFETAYRSAGLEANGPTLSWTLFRLINSLSEGITAAIVILVTVLLVAIALLCVRFTLLTTIEQDYGEIGVMKAVGVRSRDLRRLYLHRYLAMAVAGAAVGFATSWGLSQILLRNVRLYMGPAGRTVPSLLIGLTLCVLVVATVALAVRVTLRRLERVAPVQAVRTGTAPQRHPARPSRTLSAVGDRPGVNVRLGLRDLRGRAGLYAVPLVVYTLTAFILVVPQNLHTTVTAPNFITYMGAGVSDMRIDVQQPADPARAAEVGQALAGDPLVARHASLATASYTTDDADGAPTTLKIESGDLAAFPLTYMDGRAPSGPGEIGLSRLQADVLGKGLGDQLDVTPVVASDAAGALELAVTGIYQDVTNGGRTAKMVEPHTSADLMWATLYADFAPGTEVEATIASYAADHPDLKVSSVPAYVDATLGGTIDSLARASIYALVIGLAVAGLITALFMRMLIARDVFPVAVMRALGFRDSHIQRQYVVRALVVLVVGVVFGTLLANTAGGSLASVLLSAIGLSQLDLVAQPLLAYLATPLALLLVVGLATIASTRQDSRTPVSTLLKD
nr:FtsX-like permease family protein [Actinomycetales bacterium]